MKVGTTVKILALSALFVGSEHKVSAQSVDFGAVPTTNAPGKAADGRIYFYATASWPTTIGSNANVTAAMTLFVCPVGGGTVVTIPTTWQGGGGIGSLPPPKITQTCGTAAMPQSTVQLIPGKYNIWIIMRFYDKTNNSTIGYVSSTWYTVTVTAGQGATVPAAAQATVTITQNANAKGQINATAKINIPSAYNKDSNPNGWSINGNAVISAILQNGQQTIGPGGDAVASAVPTVVDANNYSVTFQINNVPTGTYTLVVTVALLSGTTTQQVSSNLSPGYQVP